RPSHSGRRFLMTVRSWVRKLFARTLSTGRKAAARRPACRPTLEALEDRMVPSTFTVVNVNDSGTGSLRQAILDANSSAGPDVINFDASTFATARTIRLASMLPIITDDLAINGPGQGLLTLSGDANNDGVNDPGDVRILFVNRGSVSIADLTLSGGRAQG